MNGKVDTEFRAGATLLLILWVSRRIEPLSNSLFVGDGDSVPLKSLQKGEQLGSKIMAVGS